VDTESPTPSGRYRAVFRCIDGCPGDHALNEILYRCPQCQGLLEVAHDPVPLREKSADEWKNLFESRLRSSPWPYGSGVWGKKEWVCPHVSDDNIVSTGEGGSALLRMERLGKQWGLENLWIKECGHSHTGSFKDLGMTVLVSMVNQMRADGRDIPAVICASTGDTSAALAAYCALAGIPAVVLLPKDKISRAQLVQPLAHGAITLALDTDFDGCMRVVQELSHRENLYLANSMNSLRVEGQKTVSFEICQQLGWRIPDFILIPGGNLGNVSALGKGFVMLRDLAIIDRLPRIVCAQAKNANPLYRSYLNNFSSFEPLEAEPTLASAIQIGDPVSVKKAIKTLQEFDGCVEQASESELAEAAAEADRYGLYCCPHTGVALAALKKLIRKGEIGREKEVVLISTAHGLKFTDFKTRYHEGSIKGVDSRRSNRPLEAPASYPRIRDTLFRALAMRGVGPK